MGALRQLSDFPGFKSYWTVSDYVRDSATRDDFLRFARAASDDPGVIQEAYTYERRFNNVESAAVLFLDGLSECHLTSPRAFEVFNLLRARSAKATFRTIVSVASHEAPASDEAASKALAELFESPVASVVRL